MQKTPLEIVRERFNDKAGLVKAVRDMAGSDLWIERLNDDKGLECVSNQKLLHLHGVLTEVKAAFGSRDKLIAAVLEAQGRSKDADYRTGLERRSTPALWDLYRAAKKKS